MTPLRLTLLTFIIAGFASCSASPSGASDSATAGFGDIDLINTVYDKFVFAIDSDGDEINNPERYFTANALKKLQDDYTFDCDNGPCYAYHALRTEAQDSKPGSDDTSTILSVEPSADGWLLVSYSDMGWPGKTRIRIVDGKIDDYQRIQP